MRYFCKLAHLCHIWDNPDYSQRTCQFQENFDRDIAVLRNHKCPFPPELIYSNLELR
jgi:hypothetical protein